SITIGIFDSKWKKSKSGRSGDVTGQRKRAGSPEEKPTPTTSYRLPATSQLEVNLRAELHEARLQSRLRCQPVRRRIQRVERRVERLVVGQDRIRVRH